MDNIQRVFRILNRFTTVIVGFITVGLLTRYLGVSGFGNYILVFAYLAYFEVFADFSLQLTIVSEFTREHLDLRTIYGTYIWLKVIIIIISTAFALYVLYFFFPYQAEVKVAIVFGSLAVSIGNLTGLGIAIYETSFQDRSIKYFDMISKIVALVLTVVFIQIHVQFIFIILNVLIGNFVALIPTLIGLRKIVNFKAHFNTQIASKIVQWSVPIGFASFLSFLYFKQDTLMLSVIRDSTEVGIYSLAFRILEYIILLWGLYITTIFSSYSIDIAIEKKQELEKVLRKTITQALLVSLLLLVGMYFTAPLIIAAIGGKDFSQSVKPLQILMFSVPFIFLNNIFYNLFLLERRFLVVLVGMNVAMVTNFVLNVIFIPLGGYIAASYITLASEIILLLVYLTYGKIVKVPLS